LNFLTESEHIGLFEVANRRQLWERRNVLISSFETTTQAQMRYSDVPLDQLLLDLSFLRDKPRELKMWLSTAKLMLEPYPQDVNFLNNILKNLDEAPQNGRLMSSYDTKIHNHSLDEFAFLINRHIQRTQIFSSLIESHKARPIILCGDYSSELSQFVAINIAKYEILKLSKATKIGKRKFIFSPGESTSLIRATLQNNTNFHTSVIRSFQSTDLTDNFSKSSLANAFRANGNGPTRLVVSQLKGLNTKESYELLSKWTNYWSEFPFEESEYLDGDQVIQTVIPVLEIYHSREDVQTLSNFSSLKENPKMNKEFIILEKLGMINYTDIIDWISNDEDEIFSFWKERDKRNFRKLLTEKVSKWPISMDLIVELVWECYDTILNDKGVSDEFL